MMMLPIFPIKILIKQRKSTGEIIGEIDEKSYKFQSHRPPLSDPDQYSITE